MRPADAFTCGSPTGFCQLIAGRFLNIIDEACRDEISEQHALWPHFTVSLCTSLMNKSNSGVRNGVCAQNGGVQQSASMLNGAESLDSFVSFEDSTCLRRPVNVTTPRSSTWSRMLRAEPQMSKCPGANGAVVNY